MSELEWHDSDDEEVVKPDEEEEEPPKAIYTAPAKQTQVEDDDDDWENTLEKEEEEKRKQQKQKEDAEKKLKEQQKRSQQQNKKKEEPIKKAQPQPVSNAKPLSKDEEEYIRQKSDLENVTDLLGSSTPFAKKTIELLKPKNEREFNELADLIVEKANESNQSNQYLNFVKRVMEGITRDMKIVDQKAVSTHLTNLIKKREEDEKIAKSKPAPTKKASKITLKVDDPYDFGGSNKGGSAYDDDDSFM